MSILYCCLILNKEQIKIAESSSDTQFNMQIKSLLPQIFKNTVNDRIEFESYLLTYTRSKEIIYICVSPKKVGEEKPRYFLDLLIKKLNSKDIELHETIEARKANKTLGLINKLQGPINNQINYFNSGFENANDSIINIQKDIDEINKDMRIKTAKQVEGMTNLKENLLTTTENLKHQAKFFQKNTNETKKWTRFFCKPTVQKYFIVIGVILSLFLIYYIIAKVRCDSFNAFCNKI
jgi:hypothetical protein